MEVPAKFRSVWAGFRYLLLALVLITTSLFLISCGSGGTTITETGGSGDLSFEINYLANVTTGATTSITAYVTKSIVLPEGGNGTIAAQDVTVTFQIIDNQSQSTLDAASVVTGSDGLAAVTYTAGPTDSVTDTVRVRVTGVPYQDALITVNQQGTGTIALTVSATPDTLEAVTDVGARNKATIAATVTSAAGVLVGEDVTFTTTAGTLCDYPNCTAAASTAQTDANGIARIILQSSTNLETADVEAQVGTDSGSTTVTFIAGPASDFTLFASPPNITVSQSITSTVTALVSDSAGHLVVDGTTVNFSVKPNSPAFGSFVEIPPTDQTVGGVATVTFKPGTTTGAVNIRASSGGANSDDADPTYGDGLITLIAEVVGSVSVGVNPSTLTADGASPATVTATVLNSDGSPVNAGTSVTFTTSAGVLDTDPSFTNPQISVTTSTGFSGEASVSLRSSTTAGQYFVTATAGGRSGAAQVNFIAGLADAGNSTLTVSPATIPADGSSTAIMTLTAQDSIGNPVADGKTVGFTANDPGVVISNQTTTVAGVARATLTSTNTPGIVTLSAAIDTITENTTINFGTAAGANPNSIDLVLSGTYLTVESTTGSDAIQIEATVRDASGNPIGVDCDNNITFTKVAGPADVTLDGSLAPVTKTTNGGVASVTLNAGITPGTVRVQVTASQDTGDCSSLTPTTVSVTTTAIIIASGSPANLFLFPDSDAIDEPDSSLTSRIFNAIITDIYGNPVENGTAVSFRITAALPGEQICPTGYTGIDTGADDCAGVTTAQKGVARTKLSWSPEFIWTTFTINAETLGGSGPVTDDYSGTYPAVADVAINVNIVPASVTAPTAGTVTVSVVAQYQDGSAQPNPIIGRTVNFTSSNPAVASVDTATDVTDEFGYGYSTLTVGCVEDSTSVEITASDLPFSGAGTLQIVGAGAGNCP